MIVYGPFTQIPATPKRVPLAPGCADCGAPAAASCDVACPSHLAADHARLLAEVDAWEDHQQQTYRESWSA